MTMNCIAPLTKLDSGAEHVKVIFLKNEVVLHTS